MVKGWQLWHRCRGSDYLKPRGDSLNARQLGPAAACVRKVAVALPLQRGDRMESNLRQYPRAPLTGTVRFYEWNRPHQADAAEISANGMFLKTSSTLPEGSMVTVRVSIPGVARAFTVLGKVVRTVRGNLLRPGGMGISFVDIAAADRRNIVEYVARRALSAA